MNDDVTRIVELQNLFAQTWPELSPENWTIRLLPDFLIN
jgi:hypothetical protein